MDEETMMSSNNGMNIKKNDKSLMFSKKKVLMNKIKRMNN